MLLIPYCTRSHTINYTNSISVADPEGSQGAMDPPFQATKSGRVDVKVGVARIFRALRAHFLVGGPPFYKF